MMDAGEEIAGVQVLLERMHNAIGDSMEHSEFKLGNLTIHHYARPDRADQQFGYFVDQNCIRRLQ